MIKLNFIFSILFFSVALQAQINRVDYYVLTKNTIDTTNVRTFLLFNKNESIFIWNSKLNNENNELTKGEDGEVKFTRILNDTIGLRVLNLFSSDSIKIIDKILQDKFKFDEEKSIQWDIINESKFIGGYKCLKATTFFRGRKYFVWFTEEIPISSGPWKLNGLPGLILEAIDEKNEVSFKLKSIKSTTLKSIINLYDCFQFEKTTLRKFIEKKDNYHKENLKEITSKLPRGTNVEALNFSTRNGIEKFFEWEN
jgi:GLPGLI family protein